LALLCRTNRIPYPAKSRRYLRTPHIANVAPLTSFWFLASKYPRLSSLASIWEVESEMLLPRFFLCLNRYRLAAHPFLVGFHFKGHMVFIASVAVSPTPRAIGWSLKLSMSCKVEFASRDVGAYLLDYPVMIDQGLRDPAIERRLRQIPPRSGEPSELTRLGHSRSSISSCFRGKGNTLVGELCGRFATLL
jgi:hypothetical protein